MRKLAAESARLTPASNCADAARSTGRWNFLKSSLAADSMRSSEIRHSSAGNAQHSLWGKNTFTALQRQSFRINGQADLCAAFSDRACRLLLFSWRLGLIVTNTISEGDTRNALA